MVRDPLDMFNSIGEDTGPDYPGKRTPKNRGKVLDTPSHEWLNDLQSYEYSVGGAVKRFYTIGSLAQALNRSAVTIRSWEDKGWLPAASFRTPPPRKEQIPGKALKGRRLYSEAQVVFLVEAAITFRIDDPYSPDWAGFRKHIANHYPKH